MNPTNTNGEGDADGPSVIADNGDFPFGVGANGEFPIIIVHTRRQDRYYTDSEVRDLSTVIPPDKSCLGTVENVSLSLAVPATPSRVPSPS